MTRCFSLLVGLALPALVLAAEKSTPVDPPAADDLVKVMRTFILTALPTPLADKTDDWGKKREVTVGIKWEKDGPFLKPKSKKAVRNDGTWRRIRVDADNPEQSLNVVVRNVKKTAPGVITFDMVITLKVKIQFEQQRWVAGEKIYSSETRAKCRPILALQCESTTKAVKTGSFLPDLTFRLRVLKADLSYDHLVVEHTLGVGGDLAEAIGKGAVELIDAWKPSLQKKMLEKANQSIVKAGDTKEIKLGLGKLLDGK